MSRRMTVMTRGLVLLMSLCLLSDVGEAGQRRRRARSCQPTCCQPQPVACAPSADIPHFCAWWKVFDMGSVCYYYAPHCPGNPMSMTPMMIAGPCQTFNPDSLCGNAANEALCVPDGTVLNQYRSATVSIEPSYGSRVLAHPKLLLTADEVSGKPGPQNIDSGFTVTRVNENAMGEGWYYLEFAPNPQLSGQKVVARVAQYDVMCNRDPHKGEKVKINIGRQVVRPTGDTKGDVVVPVGGSQYAFYVTTEKPLPGTNKKETFLVILKEKN